MANKKHLLRWSVAIALLAALSSVAAAPLRKPPLKSKTIPPVDESADAVSADDDASDPTAPRYGEPQTIRFRVGAEITASNGACRGIVAMVTVPLDCPEQKVTIVDEDFSPEIAEVTYRPLAGGEVKQMLISMPRLNNGATAHAFSPSKSPRARFCRPKRPTT